MSLDKNIFIKILKDIFKNDLEPESENIFNTFNNGIRQADALIAGGAVLSAYTGGTINDLDIYVHISRVSKLKDVLVNIGFQFSLYLNYIAPPYDQSFFKRNNILSRFRMYDLLYRYPDIDLMIIPDAIPLRNVVTNFDLSFCEIWYDGITVEAVDPTGVLSKKGVLKKDYLENLLVFFNMYTIKRMRKYKIRGFTIDIICFQSSYTFQNSIQKHVTSPEEWVVYKIYYYIIKNFFTLSTLIPVIRQEPPYDNSFTIFCKCQMGEYTLEHLNYVLSCLEVLPQNIPLLYRTIFHRQGYKYFPAKYRDYINDILKISEDEMIIFYRDKDDKYTDVDLACIYKFEEADDIDERIIPNNTCTDLFSLEDDIDIIEHLNAKNTTLFISKNHNNEFDVFCFEISYFENILENKDDNWFYECTGPFIERNGVPTNDKSMVDFNPTAYIKIPLNNAGLNGFISLIQIIKLIRVQNKIFYIYPYLEDGIQKMITHSASWQNSFGPSSNRNYVSANHCQSGSNILVYTLKICTDPERCVRSVLNISDGRFKNPRCIY